MTEAPAPPSSPCIGVCRMEGPYCAGCRRTLAEIAQWRELTEAERLRIMRELPARRRPATLNPCPNPGS